MCIICGLYESSRGNYMDSKLMRAFFDCGDDQIIQFAIQRCHYNRKEKEILKLILEENYTQEETADIIGYSTRYVQEQWYRVCHKMLSISWVKAYAVELLRESKTP